MNVEVLCAALAFLLVVVLGLSADVRPPTVITRALVAGLGTACLVHMGARWLQGETQRLAAEAAGTEEVEA